MKKLILIIALLGVVASACDHKVMYDHNYRVDPKGWHMDDSLVFNLHADDTVNTYLCCIDIRNLCDYPYSNIYFFIQTIYPDGALASDTNIEFTLAQPDGKWLGRVNGRYIDGRYPLCYFHFPQQGDYQFIVRHAMRDSLLYGIRNIGMHVELKK